MRDIVAGSGRKVRGKLGVTSTSIAALPGVRGRGTAGSVKERWQDSGGGVCRTGFGGYLPILLWLLLS